jgi:outer membrane murein-binding lipoprotein Lpp
MILTRLYLHPAAVTVVLSAIALAGCGAPNKANIKLRKQSADLRAEIERLERAQEGYAATINALERNATTVPVLPGERLDRLYSTHGIKFGRLTGGADLDREKPGDDGFKVYVVPTDQDGDIIKAAGSFVVEAFELGRKGEVRLGRWEFPLEEAKKLWYGAAMSYGYVLPCPWQTVPQGSEVTIRTTFTDELTRRRFTDQTQIKATPPAQPATNPTVAG